MARRHVLAFALATLALSQSAGAAEVTDQAGRRFTFDKPPERTVLLPIPAASAYMSIDGTDRHIVGMSQYAADAMREGILGKLFPGYRRIATNITFGEGPNITPNIEGILALRPDAVVKFASSGANTLDPLDQIGIRVLGMRVSSVEELGGYLTMFGQVAGKETRAKEIVTRIYAEQKRLEGTTAGVPDAQRPRVLYLNRAAQILRVPGKNSHNDFYIRLAGGKNVAGDLASISTITIEQILTWNPQVIVLGNFDAAMPSDIYNDPKWQSIDAVKNRRVYRMPLGGYRWDPPSQESALGWIWLAGLLQPDVEKTNLRATMRDWFNFLYGHALTDDEIDGILFAAQNRSSAGYERYLMR